MSRAMHQEILSSGFSANKQKIAKTVIAALCAACLFVMLTMSVSKVAFSQNGSDTGVAVCNGLPVTVNLNLGQKTTPNDDVVLGTEGADDIRGKAGNDTICGMGGDDFIHGNSGDDWIDGGTGVDNLRGGQGNDILYTGLGSTVGTEFRAFGGYGDDEINGGADADDLRGGRGVDTIYGRAGNDELSGNEDNDVLNGGGGDDLLHGGGGDDLLRGGGSNADVCDGGTGAADSATSSCETVENVPLFKFTGPVNELNPEFSPDITRYSIIANESLAVTVQSSESTIVSINGTIVPRDVLFDLSAFSPGDTITLSVSIAPDEVVDYEVVYLPSNFPELKVTTLTENVSDGEVYLALRQRGTDYNTYFITAIDNHGVPVFYREIDEPTHNFRRHVTGEYSYSIRRADLPMSDTGRRPTEHVILDSQFNEVRRVSAVGKQNTDFHEFRLLDNGNPLVMSYEPSIRDLTPFGGEPNSLVEDSVIQEQAGSSGNVVFEWNSWGHINYADELRGDLLDYAHVNAIDIADDDNLIVTARGTSQISKVDKASGSILWTFGGVSNEFTFLNDPYSNLCGPHTASILDNGNLLIFDNGQHCWPENPSRGELTRVVEYTLDQTNQTAELVWSYSQPESYTLSGGSAQRLDNGNTLIGWNRGSNILATEVDQSGNKVFELEATYGGVPINSYRAYRFP